jgi:hypothetical protein
MRYYDSIREAAPDLLFHEGLYRLADGSYAVPNTADEELRGTSGQLGEHIPMGRWSNAERSAWTGGTRTYMGDVDGWIEADGSYSRPDS